MKARIVLRDVEPTDFDQIFKWENAPENWLQSGIEAPYSKAEIRAYVRQKQSLETDHQVRKIIVKIPELKPIGAIDLFAYNALLKTAELGILIDPKYRRQGFALEAIAALELLSRTKYALSTIQCWVLDENTGSHQLFEKSGYIKTSKSSIYLHQSKTYTRWMYQKELV